MQRDDIIIIGAGIAGLSLGALFAEKTSHQVLILEAGHHPGGRARVIERDGFLLDWGIHALLFGERSSIVRVLKTIGASVRVRGAGMAMIKGGRRLQIIGESPLRSLGFKALGVSDIRVIFRSLGRSLRSGAVKDISVAEWLRNERAGERLADLLKVFSIGLLATTAYERASMMEIIRFLISAAKTPTPIGYPEGGWNSIIAPLINAVNGADNVKVLTGKKVTRIKVENRRVKGVFVGDSFYPAQVVVAAIPSRSLLSLVDTALLGEDFVKNVSGMRYTAGVSIDYALRKKISYEKRVLAAVEPPSLGWFVSNVSPAIVPSGRQLLTLFSPVSEEDLSSRSATETAFQRLESFYFNLFPDIERNILWDRRMKVIVNGVELSTEHSLRRRPAIAVPGIKNLYLIGDTVAAPGAGGEIAARSALECFQKIIKRQGLQNY
ncbi:MAG: FAD-dependent oxidoreductase [bacterium]